MKLHENKAVHSAQVIVPKKKETFTKRRNKRWTLNARRALIELSNCVIAAAAKKLA